MPSADNEITASASEQRVKSLLQTEYVLAVAVLLAAVLCCYTSTFSPPLLLSRLFNAVVRAGSTPKDAVVGDVRSAPLAASELTAKLEGKRALVVGGTRGVGRGIALTLVRAGASVSVVGRDTSEILGELERAAVDEQSSDRRREQQTFESHSADLGTVAGGRLLGKALAAATEEGGASGAFDYVFFTVGCWPNYRDPHTPDGVERVVALDLLAHHVVLLSLTEHGLLKPGARIMNTIASTQNFPFQSSRGVRQRLEDSIVDPHSRGGGRGGGSGGPGPVPFTLFPVAIAGDAWLVECSRRFPDLTFVGMFPGVIVTDLIKSSFPGWLVPVLKAAMRPVAITEEESGLAHVAVVASDNVGRRGVSFFNHLLEGRRAHPVALEDGLGLWVFEWLERTSASLV